jgi:hypothetical protein
MSKLHGALDEIAREAAVIRKDAERYRWLRGKHNDNASTIVVMNDQEMLEDLAGIPGDALDLDAAIDAVMQGANA